MCSCYTISWGGLGLKCVITHGYSDSSTHIYTAYIYILHRITPFIFRTRYLCTDTLTHCQADSIGGDNISSIGSIAHNTPVHSCVTL